MNEWAFVMAAYGIALAATAALLLASFARMKRAEADADKLRSNGR